MCQDIIIHVGDKRKIIIEDSSPIETTADEIAFLLRQHRKFMDYIDAQHIEGGKNVSSRWNRRSGSVRSALLRAGICAGLQGGRMTPTYEIRAKLDELGVKWWPDVYYRDTNTCWRVGDFEWRASEKKDGKLLIGCTCVKYLTPEQAIAATVGNRTDLARRLREVTGLHAFAELFGFSWEDGSDWTWHDVACAMADAVDAATVGTGTCHLEECEHEREIPYDLPDGIGGWYTEVTHDCDECGYENADPNIRFCGGCGRRVVSE